MSDEILDWQINDPRGEKLLDALGGQDLSGLSVSDLKERIKSLAAEIARSEEALSGKADAGSAAEALFKK